MNPKKDRKMKRLKIVFGLLFCMVLCHAEDYTNLSFENTDGSVVSVSVDNLSMTFSGGKLLLDNGAAATQEIAVADLSRMFFSSSTSSIMETTSCGDAEKLVYTLSGVCMGRYDAVKTLPGGMYVVKEGNKTFKMTVR